MADPPPPSKILVSMIITPVHARRYGGVSQIAEISEYSLLQMVMCYSLNPVACMKDGR